MTISPLSEPLGEQRPRILWTPSDMASSAGPEVVELAGTAGLILDDWQQYFLYYALAERPGMAGQWAANDVGLMVSRQNGKGSILEAVELADLFLLDTEMTIHSAHLFETSKEAQERLLLLIESTPDLDKFMSANGGKVWRASGQEGIELRRDGKKRRLKFKTRTKGGGRGLSGDRVIIDEAMYYTSDQDQALRPVLSARANSQMWLTGSAGDKDSTAFGRMRQIALKGSNPRLLWMEWSIDGCSEFCPRDCTEHDPQDTAESYAKANPGLGIRITVEGCEGERQMMDKPGFAQERLGVGDWPVEGEAWQVVSEEAWRRRTDVVSSAGGPHYIFGIDVTPDRKRSCIVSNARSRARENHVHCEITGRDGVLDCRPDTGWVVPRCKEIVKNLPKGGKATFVINKSHQAGPFVAELEALGFTVLTPSMLEYAQWCGKFRDSVVPGQDSIPDLLHVDQGPLSAAVAGAVKRDWDEYWAWDRANAAVDIGPLVAATLARYGYDKTAIKPVRKPKAAFV